MTIFQREYQRLNAAQRAAVDAIEGPVLVLAGPGTGKTQLLSMRVANILRRTDVAPQNILCLTFTESGQQAMQQRLMELIGEAASSIPVHTFHGFGTAIIASNPEYFFDAKTFRPADDLRLFEIYYALFEHLPHRNPLSRRAYGDFIYLKDTQERISQLKAAGLTPDGLRKLIKLDQAWCQPADKAINSVLASLGRISKDQLGVFEGLLQQLQSLKQPVSPFTWWQPLGKVCTEKLAEALEAVRQSGKTTALTAWKKDWLQTNQASLGLKASRQYSKLEALADLYEAYLAALREHQLFDYDDMILEVLRALDNHSDLLASLQEQYHYILVDEYQDTNGAQAQLIERLADNPVNENRPNLMVVGDDDQAIYGFQGARAGIMLYFRERWRDVTTITLTDNYRSQQGILDAIRGLITQGQERLENYYEDINKTLRAAAPADATAPRLFSWDDEAEQLSWLSQEIARLLEQGIPATEIAVLAPRHKYLQRALPYFKATGVEVWYERRQNILDQPELKQLLLLANTCVLLERQAEYGAEKLLPELLSYPFWHVTPESIWKLSLDAYQQRQSWPQQLESTTDKTLTEAWQWLLQTAPQTNGDLDAILTTLLAKIEQGTPNASLRSALDVLRYHLRIYQPEGTLRLTELVRYANLCRQAGIYLSEQIGEATTPQGVQIMTAHKAKGLEFEVVFVMNAHETVWASERGQHNKLSLPPNLSIQPPGESRDDRLRLLYVASSRAKQQLIFSTYRQDGNGKVIKPLQWLEAIADQLGSTPVITPVQKQLLQQSLESFDWRDLHWQTLTKPAARSLLNKRLSSYCLSPTHLMSFLDLTHGGPKHFLTDHLLAFPHSLPLDASFGQLMHATLDTALKAAQANGKLPPAATVLKDFDVRLAAMHLSELDAERLQARGHDALSLYIKERGASLLQPQKSEQTFTTKPADNQPRLTGRVDRLLTPDHQPAIIVDLKTGKSFDSWQGKTDYDKLKLHTFQLQLTFYKLLVEQSDASLHVTEGKIEFIEGDSEDQLHSLSYAYKPHEEERITKLINAVWRSITKLDLPETPADTTNFKDVLAFEEKLLEH